jgi:hypothetical protein
MSNRSTFPDGIEVHSRHLTFESESRIADRKDDILNQSMTGVVSGLEVTVNGGDDTKIDVAAGSGYAPNCELRA